MKYDKIVLDYDSNTKNIYDNAGNYLSTIQEGVDVHMYEELDIPTIECSSEEIKPFINNSIVVELVKLGITTDEIIKLKHNDLL